MRKLVLASLLLCAPVLSADSPLLPHRTVREYVINSGVENWWLDGGWSWNNGTLTHWSGSGKGTATLRSMPSLLPGHTYAVDFTHSGSTTGTVRFSMGKDESPAYSWSGRFPFALTITDPDALLTLTPTDDYDGSISDIRVVELGDELVDDNAWTLSEGWSREGKAFRHAAGEPASLICNVPLVAGHVYRVYLGVSEVTDPDPGRKGGTVSIGGEKGHWFAGWNFSFEMVAPGDGPLVIDPVDGNGWFGGTVSRISVREMISDPVSAPAPTNP